MRSRGNVRLSLPPQVRPRSSPKQFRRHFREFGELLPGLNEKPPLSSPMAHMISSTAAELGVWIIGGAIAELHDGKIYNTCIVVDDRGVVVGKYRKLHLFDVSIPPSDGVPGITFRESETLTPGDLPPCLVATPWGFDIGIGICYDIRYPEYATLLRESSSNRMKFLVYPGAFNTTTGPMHWELLGRARAVDTQSYCILASIARSNDPSDYQAYGHSMVISPYGKILAELDEKEGIAIADLDMSQVDRMRRSIPTHDQKRRDVYRTDSV